MLSCAVTNAFASSQANRTTVPQHLIPIAIRYIGIISGKETCEFWACRKSKQFLTFRCRIRSSSDWLSLSVESA